MLIRRRDWRKNDYDGAIVVFDVMLDYSQKPVDPLSTKGCQKDLDRLLSESFLIYGRALEK